MDQHPGLDRADQLPFAAIPVVDLELTQPWSTSPANAQGQLLALVRLHGIPLGALACLTPTPSVNRDLVGAAVAHLTEEIVEHLLADGLSVASHRVDDLAAGLQTLAGTPCAAKSPRSAAGVTVVVCTLGQDPRLLGTVRSVLAQQHDDLELLVVDNDPDSHRVPALLVGIDDPRLAIVPEPRRGLSVARNTGLALARHPVVAYTDDDAVADPRWLAELTSPFQAHPDVVSVTGLVLPAELATPAQVLFEEFGAFDKGFRRTVWTRRRADAQLAALGPAGDGGVLFPYSAGVFGSGNNMAFRTEWLRQSGGFDVALGAGTYSRGGEDLDAFLDVILADRVLVYEPRAVVRHYARSDLIGLKGQLYGYGTGMSAVVAKRLLGSPGQALSILARLPAGLRKLLDPSSAKNEHKGAGFPKELSRLELRGYLAGPFLYARSRRAARGSRSSARLSDDRQRRRSLAIHDVPERKRTQPPGGHRAQSEPRR